MNAAEDQWQWIENTLAASTAQWLFVVGHYPGMPYEFAKRLIIWKNNMGAFANVCLTADKNLKHYLISCQSNYQVFAIPHGQITRRKSYTKVSLHLFIDIQ